MRTDPAFMRFAVDKCLERLETDYIDVLQLHNAKMEHVRDAELWGTMRELQREGKIRAWGAAFGPAIGWLYEAVELVEREPDINTIQMIWNVLEQHPGTAMIEAAKAHAPNCCFNVRVTHASGMLEGKYTEDTVFPENDHRRHRPRSWLDQRRQEGEDARLPHARHDARPGGAQVAARRAARRDDAAEHLRRRAARRVRRGERPAAI